MGVSMTMQQAKQVRAGERAKWAERGQRRRAAKVRPWTHRDENNQKLGSFAGRLEERGFDALPARVQAEILGSGL